MATLSPKLRKLAKRLAVLTVAAGEQAPSEAKAALEHVLAGSPLDERRAFTKIYLSDLKREIEAAQLRIEHAGPLDANAVREIAQNFSDLAHRDLTVVTQENPALIAGLRLFNGDNVYDASVAGRLERLVPNAS